MNFRDYLVAKDYLTSKLKACANFEKLSFSELFKEVSQFLVFSSSDYAFAVDTFEKLVSKELSKMNIEFVSRERQALKRSCKCLKRVLMPHEIKVLEAFSDMVVDFADELGCKSVLDVGSGEVPHSAIRIAESVENVGVIDYNPYDLSYECLKQMGVDAKTGYFNRDKDVSEYDMVVGQRPCSAIVDIVCACKKANVPYFIELCGCEMPVIRSEDGWSKWEDILPEYDKDVCVEDNYAYNLHMPHDKVKSIIAKHKVTPVIETRSYSELYQ